MIMIKFIAYVLAGLTVGLFMERLTLMEPGEALWKLNIQKRSKSFAFGLGRIEK